MHEDHVTNTGPEAKPRLDLIQAEVERRAPSAERCINYGMPALLSGRLFFYFAAFKNHTGVYSPVGGPPELLVQLEP